MSEEVKVIDDEELTEEQLDAKYGDPIEEPEETTESTEKSPDTEPETAESDKTEAPDTDTETAEDSTKQEEVDPVMKTFVEQGLDKTYASPEVALEALKEAKAQIGRLSREQADRERLPTPDPAPQKETEPVQFNGDVWRDKFDADPAGAMKEAITLFGGDEVKALKVEIKSLQDESLVSKGERLQSQLQATISGRPGLKERESEVTQVIKADPILDYMYGYNPAWAASMAYDKVLANDPTRAPETPKPKIDPVSDTDKANAITTSGHGAPKRAKTERTSQDWDGMSEEEQEAVLGYGED